MWATPDNTLRNTRSNRSNVTDQVGATGRRKRPGLHRSLRLISRTGRRYGGWRLAGSSVVPTILAVGPGCPSDSAHLGGGRPGGRPAGGDLAELLGLGFESGELVDQFVGRGLGEELMGPDGDLCPVAGGVEVRAGEHDGLLSGVHDQVEETEGEVGLVAADPEQSEGRRLVAAQPAGLDHQEGDGVDRHGGVGRGADALLD